MQNYRHYMIWVALGLGLFLATFDLWYICWFIPSQIFFVWACDQFLEMFNAKLITYKEAILFYFMVAAPLCSIAYLIDSYYTKAGIW